MLAAFGAAATHALAFAATPSNSLTAVIAYYPPSLPANDFHPSLNILLHLPASHAFAPASSSRVTVRVYPDVVAGFAEPKHAAFDKVAGALGFSRTLALLRRMVGPNIDLEEIWAEHLKYEFTEKDADATMDTMVKEPYVNHIPTCTGGIGYNDLLRFYRDYFIPGNPPSLKMKLVSRTVGADRVVDEMILRFRHTCEIPWMLPGVPPTNKECEVALVSIVCMRGRKLYHEHIYWDQATVLVQLGLLDPKGLPVIGSEAAWKVQDEKSVESNSLIKNW